MFNLFFKKILFFRIFNVTDLDLFRIKRRIFWNLFRLTYNPAILFLRLPPAATSSRRRSVDA